MSAAGAPGGPLRLDGWRQWPREARDTLFQLAVIGWTVLPHLSHLPVWCGLLTASVLAWRARLALRGGPLPGRWPVIAVLVVAVALTWWTERTLLGKQAGVTLLVVLMALKTLELRARRDAMVVFFLGFFLVLTHCLYSQSLALALAMLVSTWGLLTALVLANMPVGRPPLRRAGAIAARSALLGLPVMAVLFVLFPRFGPLWGLPQDSVGRTGLSGTLRIGGVAELANDESIAMRVRFDPGVAPPPPEALYFRGPVLSRFDGLEWQQALPTAGRAGRSGPPDLRVGGPALGYEVLLEPIRLALLPLLEATPARADSAPDLPDWGLRMGRDLQWHTDRLVAERLRFRGRAYLRFSHGAQADESELRELRALPEGFNPRTLAWTEQLRGRLGPVDARTLAATLMAHVRQGQYVYTLSPLAYGRDAIDEFWLDGREGFCEHFATAFVVVMRAARVPARVVTGYQGAEPPDEDGFRTVRQSHAHAWAEYWQPGDGWLRADPTSAVAPERVRSSRPLPPRPGLVAGALRTISPALADRLKRGWELLDSRWSQWVMGYSRNRQFALLQSLGVAQPDWSDLARALVGLLAAAAAAGALWAWRDRNRQDPGQRLQQRLCSLLRGLDVAAQAHHGPRSLAVLVRQRHGDLGHELALALEALDLHRYGRGAAPGRALPGRAWWRRLVRLAEPLRRPTAASASAAAAGGAGGAAAQR